MLALCYFGNPILRKRAKEVTVFDDKLLKLIQEMEKTMDEHRGIGLAAPQVNMSLRLFIIRIDREDENEELIRGRLRVFINPKLSNPSRKESGLKEGCLSIPGVREEVFRPDEITIEALDETGTPFKEQLKGLEARAVMHENDHLNGTLIIDRIQAKRRMMIDPALRAIKKKYHP